MEEALRQAGWEREEIETVAVGLGPGSYTGIRGAIALAQGWQLGRGVNLLGISSVECLAAQAQAEKMCGPIHIVVDAQRNEFYLARYEIGAGRRQEAEPLRLAPFEEIERLAKTGARIIGPEATNGSQIVQRLSRRRDPGTTGLRPARLCAGPRWNPFICGKHHLKKPRLCESSPIYP